MAIRKRSVIEAALVAKRSFTLRTLLRRPEYWAAEAWPTAPAALVTPSTANGASVRDIGRLRTRSAHKMLVLFFQVCSKQMPCVHGSGFDLCSDAPRAPPPLRAL